MLHKFNFQVYKPLSVRDFRGLYIKDTHQRYAHSAAYVGQHTCNILIRIIAGWCGGWRVNLSTNDAFLFSSADACQLFRKGWLAHPGHWTIACILCLYGAFWCELWMLMDSAPRDVAQCASHFRWQGAVEWLLLALRFLMGISRFKSCYFCKSTYEAWYSCVIFRHACRHFHRNFSVTGTRWLHSSFLTYQPLIGSRKQPQVSTKPGCRMLALSLNALDLQDVCRCFLSSCEIFSAFLHLRIVLWVQRSSQQELLLLQHPWFNGICLIIKRNSNSSKDAVFELL